jgi:tryptophanyl-tRNA synthetase
MKTMFSGMQPTGAPHVGNWLGALKNWVGLAKEYDSIFCIVDLHAMTVEYEVAQMRERIRNLAAVFLASGLPAPEHCPLFVQSHVQEHTQLAWIFNTVTPMGELGRMTQFKDKAAQHAKNINTGLFTYPLLQAADILLYKGEVVPVGEDQVQHIELARIVARKFNNRFGEFFAEPKEIVTKGSRILGLDGKSKMSKSLGNHIEITEDPDSIRTKLKGAVTDPKRMRRSDPGDPSVCNLFTLHKHFSTPEQQEWAATGCRSAGIGCFDCKKVLADNMIEQLAPIREKALDWIARPKDLDEVLDQGARTCRARAQKTMDGVRALTGL